MPKYTTGEIAKLCDVTVRTVQYYDKREILVPSELSEGGRRLYSEDDLKRLKIICFLRELNFSIDAIGKLLAEEHPANVIALLIEEQEQIAREDLKSRQETLEKLSALKRECKAVDDFSVESIRDIALIMENKKKLKKVHLTMLLTGIPLELVEIAAIVLWILKGIWWPFVLCMCAMVIYGVWTFGYYTTRTAYICPECHEVFRPTKKEVFWAAHTPRTRKLTCKHCGHRGYCVEIYNEEKLGEA